MKDEDIYLEHILDAIEKIKSYTRGKTLEDFFVNTQLQDSVVRNLEIIGEASRRLSDELKSKVNLPWNEISAMRNKIVHDYFELNLEIIWETAIKDILDVEKELVPLRSIDKY